MLRALDERGGVSVYSRNIAEELVGLGSEHTFFLYFRSRRSLAGFSDLPGASRKLLRAPGGKAAWDQIRVPVEAWRDRLDVLFHPKFTVPLMAPCPCVMTVHGADWFMPDQKDFYGRLDVAYVRRFMPLYFRKCARVISVSRLTTENFEAVLPVARGRTETVYFAPARHFSHEPDEQARARVADTYELPSRFFLSLTKLRGGEDRKNLPNLIEGYARYWEAMVAQGREPVSLVVGGAGGEVLRERLAIEKQPWAADTLFPGWIEQRDLPAVYRQAVAFVYPSNFEAFPIPITEAMKSGTPVVTSRANGLREIAGDAALYVDPRSPDQIASALGRIAGDPGLAQELSKAGRRRVETFSWHLCARRTLEILELAAGLEIREGRLAAKDETRWPAGQS